jgi:endonuclease G, mitochondrial
MSFFKRIGLSIFLSTLVVASALAWDQSAPLPLQSCAAHVPFGMPTAQGVQPICRTGYLVGYDAGARLPRFVMYTLQPQNALGCVARSNAFVADRSIQNGATPQDYASTGFDKGHMAPDGDMSWNQQVEYESFLMTNMSPQAGSLNRGIWKLLETSVRGWAVQRNHAYTIYVGGIYDQSDRKIGNGVVVPHAFYKIVIDDTDLQVAGWVFPHTAPYPNLGNDLTKFRVPVSQIEQRAGVAFAFPPNVRELNPGQEWSVDFGALTNAKRAKCGANATID